MEDNLIKEDTSIKVYQIIDLQPSTFILQGTENSGSPVHLEAAALTRIPNVSMRKVKGKAGKSDTWQRIRYISGCPTIVEAEQKQQGYEPNRNTGADEIYAVAGKLVALSDVEPQKVEFLDSCGMNISNPDRKPNCTPLFKELKQDEEAKENVADFFTIANVTDALKELATKDATGYKFNEDAIDNLCSLLLIAGFEPSQYTLKFNAIASYGMANPELFLRKVADRNASMKATILQGLEFGVIGWEGDALTFTENQRVIFSANAKDKDGRISEAAQHLMNGSAITDLNLLTIGIRAKKDSVLALQQ